MYDVLVVDDDKLMRDALVSMINRFPGFHVLCEAETGEEAVKICRMNHVDIVFLDIIMPGMTGVESGKIIIRENPDIEICILSAYTEFHFATDALEIRAKKYMSKPVSISKITSFLEEYDQRKIGWQNPQSVRAVELVKQENFLNMYNGLGEVVSDVFRVSGSKMEQLLKTFLSIGQNLMDLLEDLDQRKKVQDIFPILEVWLENEEIMKLWLFRVMNYVYQQQSIKRYQILEEVFLYIEQHLTEKVSLNHIAQKSMISQGYLSRIFRKQFGISVMEYIRLRKIHMAKVNFAFSSHSTTEVAFKLGFNESGYLSKVFQKYEGMSIQEYRQSVSNKIGTTI